MNREQTFLPELDGDAGGEVSANKMKLLENRLKLDILESLARSQKALARMIENMADVTGQSDAASRELVSNAKWIGKYQIALAEKMTGMRIAYVKLGNPGKLWLNPKLKSLLHAERTVPKPE